MTSDTQDPTGAEPEAPATEEAATPDPQGERLTALEEENAKLRYALAEADNSRKRAQRDGEEQAKYAIHKFARDLLTVLDDLERALAAVPEDRRGQDSHLDGLLGGVESTARELSAALQRHGVERIEAVGKPFEPNLHEAMFEVPTNDAAPGTVVQEIQPGYVLQGRLLRPARVGVARPQEGGSAGVDTTV